MSWQLVMIAWGTKYGAADINALHEAVRRHSTGLARAILITDRARPGLHPGIETRDFPAEFLAPRLRQSGCQAKLAMFREGLLPADMPAIFLDLDTVVLGDVSKLLAACPRPENVAILQSVLLPFGALARAIHRLTKGRKYARGNSSVVVFHPAHCGYIAARFQELFARFPDFGFRPMVADERFISWCAQPVMRRVPSSLVVKFPTEFMYPWLWLGRLRGALPWVRRRRAGLVAITLPGEEVKAEILLSLPEGAEVGDRKGRRMIWSDRYLGPSRARLLAALRAQAARSDAAAPADGA